MREYEYLDAVSKKCIECGLCQKECLFLRKYGNPKAIADALIAGGGPGCGGVSAHRAVGAPGQFLTRPGGSAHMASGPAAGSVAASSGWGGGAGERMAFECSLCELCAAVCPAGVEPAKMFLGLRREAVRRGGGNYREHSAILNYERRGASPLYAWHGLPEGCDTVFFPGCDLSGTRPERVVQLYLLLREKIPSLGIVLDCCGRPSHDLGREEAFHGLFGKLASRLGKRVKTVLTACPGCLKVFREYGKGFEAKTVYEFLDQEGSLPCAGPAEGVVAVHDPCSARFETGVHAAVRSLVGKMGVNVAGMEHERQKTVCCGEGGSVRFLSPEFARRWSALRKDEAGGRRLVAYCGGCAGFLGRVIPVTHILDLLFEPEAALSGKVKAGRAPFTYWNRIRIKARFKKILGLR